MIFPDFKHLISLKNQSQDFALLLQKSDNKIDGGNLSNLYGSGLEFAEVRKYQFGDDVRNMDWRVTARTGKAHLKLFHTENEQDILILVDLNKNMHFGSKETFKSVKAANLAAKIAWYHHKNNDKIGGCVFGNQNIENLTIYPVSKSQKSIIALFKDLTNKEISKNYIKLSEVLEKLQKFVKFHSKIYIISDFANFESKITDNLKKIYQKKSEIKFLQITDPRDYQIPKMGKINFSDNFGNNIIIDSNNDSFRQKYQQNWQNNQDKFLKIVQKNNVILF